ncbi:MAG: glucosamine-6-phosphate isomerase [Spirochaetes bacterium]|nr:glucosamine-6-phosphate isomerase [Spirochaetota bacterium]
MDYYRISKEELGAGAKIPLVKMGISAEVFTAAAADMVNTIEARNAKGLSTVFIVPVGPVGHYPLFASLVNERKIGLKKVWFINMDEYLSDDDSWIDMTDSLSFRGFMERTVYSRLDPDLVMPDSQRIFPDPARPERIAQLIEKLGGVDVCYGGIGINGHLAFNEPEDVSVEEFAARPARALSISPETRTANAIGDLNGAIEAMPRRCVTIGMREILGARRVRLYCFRDWHRAVVRRAAYGEKTAHFPATLLQDHPDARITIPDSVAEPAY